MNTIPGRISTRLRVLCQILSIEDKAPVFYTQPRGNKQYLMYNKCVSDSLALAVEKNEYDAGKEYDNSKCGLYIPDISTDEFMATQKKGNPDSVRTIMGAILGKISVEEYNLTYAVFCILHELGHWVYYKESGMTDDEFYLHERPGRKEVTDLANRIRALPVGDPMIPTLCAQHEEMYRNLPSEKAADQYALEHLEEAMECVRNSFQYTVDA
ncbi:MAG: hypothetical protein LIP01_02475 [Tannerellaceae bacterium]|nr:hypothetical protein [Tannerellaceae bacterium]